MTNEDAIKWLENLKQDIGQLRHEDLWPYAQAIDEIIATMEEQENRWVSVDDRMPDEAGEYYVSGGGKVWLCTMVILCGVKGWIGSAKSPHIEAWMPKPEAYKKRSEVE